MEVLRLRLLAAFGCLDGTAPPALWPYVAPPLDIAGEKQRIRDLDAKLEWDGTRYVFRDAPAASPLPQPGSAPKPPAAENRTAAILAEAERSLLAP